MRKPEFWVSDHVQHKGAVQPHKMARGLGSTGIVLSYVA